MRNISYPKFDIFQRLSSGWLLVGLGCLFVAGLAVVRLVYEAQFPQVVWLRNPVSAVLLALLITLFAAVPGSRLLSLPATLSLTPLLLNLVYLFKPVVGVADGRFLFLTSLWLTILFIAHQQGALKRWSWLSPGFILLFLLPVYLLTMGRTVGTADTFEFQVVVPKLGIVHPTGYPLYLLLTKLFTFLPINSSAWRVNFGTAVFSLAAACLLFYYLKSLTGKNLVPVLAAVLFGLSPTLWSQSIQAEVYSLHTLIVIGVLVAVASRSRYGGPAAAFLLGLGLTNHLTTLILLPAVLLLYLLRMDRQRLRASLGLLKDLLSSVALFLLPLTLYLYLPLRWQAVNGEAMGLNRFVDWVVGGRFQGALQPMAWLNDPVRYGVVGRLFTAEWSWLHLTIALIGLFVMARRKWRTALFLGLIWLGFGYYALSYYVPDLSVFLIPAHLVTAVFWGFGAAAAVDFLSGNGRVSSWLQYPLLALLILFVFQQAVNTWHTVDDSSSDGQTTWGRVVLAQPLDPQGAILADSLKFPPLYYLQQAEGIQPDMAIMVLPDEAAYRAELDGRLGAGQTVYLARFLPGLAGVYHLGSVGPLTEVSSQPQMVLPQSALPPPDELAFGSIQLLGYDLALNSAFESGESALTFYWQTAEPVEPVWLVYLRWAGENYLGQVQSQHPANNSYPTNAWRPGEIVADFHSLPWPALNEPTELALQAALAPAFTPHDRLAWQTVTTAVWEPPTTLLEADALRLQVGSLLLDGISMPEAIRPQSSFRVQLHGYGPAPDSLSLTLLPAGSAVSAPSPADTVPASTQQDDPFTWSYDVAADVPPGSYQLVAAYPEQSAVCSWLGRQTSACALGQITVSGAPLPEGAINFDDKIALTAVNIPNKTLQPGGTLAVNLSWLGLSDLTKDYTVFVQVLDEADRIVGQLDSWPLQGTFPTSQWSAGQRLEDPYLVELSEDLPPGSYRLYLGWYLLETFERLPVLDEAGTAVDDKYIVPLE